MSQAKAASMRRPILDSMIPGPTSKADFLSRGAKDSVAGSRGNFVTAAHLGKCEQHSRFGTGQVCNRNWLVYITPPAGDAVTIHGKMHEDVVQRNVSRRVRAAMADAFYKANPALLLDDRFYFLECISHRTTATFTRSDLQQHLETLIADHLVLCDWLEQRLRMLKEGRYDEVEHYGYDDLSTSFRDTDMIMPMLRSVVVLAWPTQVDQEGKSGVDAVSLVLTGDDARMKSGPLSFDTLAGRLSPESETGDRRVRHLQLVDAVEFLTGVDKREVAANAVLRARNEACAEELRLRNGWTTSGLDGN